MEQSFFLKPLSLKTHSHVLFSKHNETLLPTLLIQKHRVMKKLFDIIGINDCQWCRDQQIITNS